MAPSDDELLTTAGMPGWVRWAAGLAALAVLLTLVALRARSHSSDPTPTPTLVPSTASAPSAPESVPPLPIVGAAAVTLPIASPVDDVVADGAHTWVLQRHTLARIDGGRLQAVTGTALDADEQPARLLLDARSGRLWLVVLDVPNTVMQVFDARSLKLLNSVQRGPAVTAAATLDGNLFFADVTGLYRVGVERPQPLATLGGIQRVVDLAGDPLRHRVLLLVSSGPTLRLWQATTSTVAVVAPAPAGLVKGQLTVTGSGQVWAAGFGAAGAVLVRLDPRTWGTIAASPLSDEVGPGALLLASGTDSLLVGPGSGSTAMWCIDGQHGVPVQRWGVLPDQAAVTHGAGYATSRGGLFRLNLTGQCTG